MTIVPVFSIKFSINSSTVGGTFVQVHNINLFSLTFIVCADAQYQLYMSLTFVVCANAQINFKVIVSLSAHSHFKTRHHGSRARIYLCVTQINSFPFQGTKITPSFQYPVIQNLPFTFRRGGIFDIDCSMWSIKIRLSWIAHTFFGRICYELNAHRVTSILFRGLPEIPYSHTLFSCLCTC